MLESEPFERQMLGEYGRDEETDGDVEREAEADAETVEESEVVGD